ncbi:MAG: chemotaxis protein CheB [Cyanobacteria bacterium P01_A01_bin.84]
MPTMNTRQKLDPKEADNNLFVVGIGASAGGLSALKQLFDHLPTNSGAAFVVIQHLSPDFKSLMKELLQRHTGMPVHRVTQGMELKPNSIYLIPPAQNLILEGNLLQLKARKKDINHKHEINFPIDLFFISLAENYQEKSIGVILSGSGSDGNRGLRAINEAGGISLVQDPKTAEFNGMPNSAIATGVVNQVLAPPELAQLIYQCVASSTNLIDLESTKKSLLSHSSLKKISNILLGTENIDFSEYKTSTMSRRIHRRRLISNLQDIESYIKLLDESEEERKILCSDLLINVTHFFRDKAAWENIENNILPILIEQAKPNEELRFWVAGCSTGEEAYSLAILIHEALHIHYIHNEENKTIKARIFATDIDRTALEKASQGIYPPSITNDISPERLQRYFTAKDNCYQVTRKLREVLIFSSHDLTRDAGFTHIHLITCRNVLIYMQQNLQHHVLRNLHFSLIVKGMLFLGESESVGVFESEFETLDSKWKIYQKQRDSKLPIIPVKTTPKIATNSRYSSYSLHPISSKTESVKDLSFQRLLKESKSTVLLVSSDNQLLHIYGDTSKIFKPLHGEFTKEITKMVVLPLQLPLNTALSRARKENQSIIYTGIKLEQADVSFNLNLKVIPPQPNRESGDFYLVEIYQTAIMLSPEVPVKQEFTVGDEAEQRILDLEYELQHTRENLQALIEELETSNEEQQASNEELIASNEELQSTNEELHSVNEELHTVNVEYQSKIQELIQLNNDIDNLLDSTNIGVIFLDSEFRIRKFTPAATEIVSLRHTDLGRPLKDLTLKIEYPQLLKLLKQVQSEKLPVELEVKHKESNSYLLMRIHPYITEEQEYEGLVISFVKTDEIKYIQQELEREILAHKRTEEQLYINQEQLLITQQQVENIFSSLEDAVWSFDLPKKKLAYVNDSFERIYGRNKQEFSRDLNLWFVVIHPEDKTQVKEASQLIEQDGKVDIEYRILHPDGTFRWLRHRSKLIYNDRSQVIRQDFIVSDFTPEKQTQQALKERELSFQGIFHSMFQLMVLLTPEGILLEANQAALDFAGAILEDVIGCPFWEAKWWTISKSTQQQLQKAISNAAKGQFTRHEIDVLQTNNSIATIDFSLKPVTNNMGEVVLLIFEVRDISDIKEAREQLLQTNLKLEQRITERTQTLANFSDRIKQLHHLSGIEYQRLDTLFTEYLQAGCQMFNLSTGIVSQVQNSVYKIVAVESPLGLKIGYESPCRDTYCAEVVDTLKTVTFEQVGKIKSMKNHTVYLNLKLESFIGTPILVNGYLYGTLNFSDTTPRDKKFTEEEIEIVELMARDLGKYIGSMGRETALKVSELRFQNTFEKSPVGMAHMSIEGKFIRVNQRLCHIVGYESDRLINLTFQEITHPEDLAVDLKYIARVLTGEIENYSIEKRYIHSNKSIIWINCTVSLAKNELGEPSYFIVAIADISDRKINSF